MFTPPNENLIWTVHRFRSTFANSIGGTQTGIGTGFWMSSGNGKRIFVTNKHNVDPSLKFPNSSDLRLVQAQVELRRFENGIQTHDTEFFTVSNLECIHSSLTADCAVLISPQLENHSEEQFPIGNITKFKDLAMIEEFNRNQIKIMEPAIFIGFPGANGRHWWDESWKLPVIRQCTLASWPAIPFTNSQIQTTDVLLVSGLSFSGSSGSPVFVMNRGLHPGGDIQDSGWRPARLIGVMSGHFWENTQTPAMFAHSGLSYLTRSTSIIEILQSANVWESNVDNQHH